jgi:hypothetical protein
VKELSGLTRCFLHVPKCAGSSVQAALEAALPLGAVAPKRFDVSVFCNFNEFNQLRPEVRALVATSAEEMLALDRYSIVSGHFSLPSLLALAPARAIASIVREPRSRLLSLYAYWKVTDLSFWEPYAAHAHSQSPLHVFLDEPAVAPVVDNQLCRLVLFGNRRFSNHGFIRPDEVEEVASEAIKQVDELGFVGLRESPDAFWLGLSTFFGVKLEPQVVNVTSHAHEVSFLPEVDFINATALELLERRTAADRIVYQHVVSRSLGEAVRATDFADAAFARQQVRFSALLGRAAQVSGP